MNSEQALISATLRAADIATPQASGVTEDWFVTHRDEWRWIETYHRRHRRVPSKGTFKATFPSFRVLLVEDVEYAVEEMRVHYAKHLVLAMVDSTVAGLDKGRDVNLIVQDAQHALVEMQGRLDGGRYQADVLRDWKATYATAYLRQRLAQGKQGASGIPTGWASLNAVTGGYHPAEYWVYSARLGQGKTWALIATVCAALANGVTVQFHGLEQSRTQLAMRFHAFLSRQYGPKQFKASELTRGLSYQPVDYKRFLAGLERRVPGRLIIDDTPRGKLTPLALAAQVERNAPKMLVIDYLTLMSQSSDWQAVGDLSGDIKALTADYNITTIVASQTNRDAGSGRNAGPEHLSRADAIGQDADGIVNLWKPSRHTAQMHLVKYRHGEDLMKWWCLFKPNEGIFDECSRDDAEAQKDLDDGADDNN